MTNMTNYVKDIWRDTDNFVVVMQGADWNVWYAFPIKALEAGASLRQMMTLKVRETLSGPGWRIDPVALKEAAGQAVSGLRQEVETYFRLRSTTEDDEDLSDHDS